jgi:hypothetical protein
MKGAGDEEPVNGRLRALDDRVHGLYAAGK